MDRERTWSHDGRWSGRLTSRPLPKEDDSLSALTGDERGRLAEIWLARAAMGGTVSASFAVIRDALVALRANAALVELAERAIDDERRHAAICRAVASRFAGATLSAPAPLPLVVPRLDGASPEMRHALHIVGQCVLNETTASAFLETCLSQARGSLARAALRELLSDEIDHARIGWTYLATASSAIREQVGRVIVSLARANLAVWRETPRLYGASPALAAHGAPSHEAIEAALLDALKDIVVPGLETVGVASGALREWIRGLRARFPLRAIA
jgi:hypothetical protein